MTPNPTYRAAGPADLSAILAMLTDDPLGAAREGDQVQDRGRYEQALAAIDADPNNELWLAELGGEVVGCFQLTFIPGLSRRGAWRMQIESVRVVRSRRGEGIGGAMIGWAIDRARAKGCAVVQLSSDHSRRDAHRFYERLGFSKSHAGFKLTL
jgi:GNAT superfamily N-acetyltransferase